MTTVDSAPRVTRIGTYLILGLAFLALLGIGPATFRTAKANHEADRKADQADEFEQFVADLRLANTAK